MKTIEVICEKCGKLVTKPLKEYTRSKKLGRNFYCNRACAGIAVNNLRKAVPFAVNCLCCGIQFISTGKKRSKKFYCSRGCASSGSYYTSEKRIQAARKSGLENSCNLNSPSETLRKREAWKYSEIEKLFHSRDVVFEFELGKFVFDLCLNDTKILVEFDGKYHNTSSQSLVDLEKNMVAHNAGFRVERIQVLENSVIPSELVEHLSTHVNS